MGHYCHDLDFVMPDWHGAADSLTHLQCFWFNQLQHKNPAF